MKFLNLNNHSVRFQILAIILSICAGAMLVTQTISMINSWTQMRDTEIHRLEIQSDMLTINSRGAVTFGDMPAATETLASLGVDPAVDAAAILVGEKILASYRKVDSFDGLDRLHGVGNKAQILSDWKNVTIIRPIVFHDEIIGSLVLLANFSQLNAKMLSNTLVSMGVFVVLLLLSAMLAMRLQALISNPLKSLAQSARRVTDHQDYSVRVVVLAENEIGDLTRAFNDMLGEIQAQDKKLRSHSAHLEQQVAKRTSDLRQLNHQLLHQATHDSLTGLPNRKYFTDLLLQTTESAKRHKQQFALLFLDLDRFKLINDTLGHGTGDELLRVWAKRLRHSVRTDDVVARFAGDEFVVMVHAMTSNKDAEAIADKIVQGLVRPIKINDHELHISTSIGLAMFPEHSTDYDTLISYADHAMYEAKRMGRNRWRVFNPNSYGTDTSQLERENTLRTLMDNDCFYPVYQPIVRMSDRHIIGFEVLARLKGHGVENWRPDEFIPMLEELGLIYRLGELFLDQVAKRKAHWNESGFEIERIALNWSPKQLIQPDVALKTAALVSSYGLSPAEIEIEITEGTLIGSEDLDTIRESMHMLSEAGFKFSLDDFGSGYSSISHLRQLQISRLKIDRSLVSDIPGNTENMGLIRGVISLAKALNIGVIAEGIETEEHAEALLKLGCEEGQGWLFGRPMLAEDAEALLTKQQQSKPVS